MSGGGATASMREVCRSGTDSKSLRGATGPWGLAGHDLHRPLLRLTEPGAAPAGGGPATTVEARRAPLSQTRAGRKTCSGATSAIRHVESCPASVPRPRPASVHLSPFRAPRTTDERPHMDAKAGRRRHNGDRRSRLTANSATGSLVPSVCVHSRCVGRLLEQSGPRREVKARVRTYQNLLRLTQSRGKEDMEAGGALVSDAVPLEHGASPQPHLSQRREGEPWRTSSTESTVVQCPHRSRL